MQSFYNKKEEREKEGTQGKPEGFLRMTKYKRSHA